MPTYPDGLDVEVFSFKVIEKAGKKAKSDFEREHVNIYIYKNPRVFKIKNITNRQDLSSHRWTLDTPKDLKLLKLIAEECNKKQKYCHLEDILKILKEHPDWVELNKNYQRNQGYKLWED